MSEQTDALRDDLSYLRSIAEQGRRGPILGGAFLVAAGVIYGIAAFVQWAKESVQLFPDLTIGNLWACASLIFAVVWVVLYFRLRGGGARVPGATQFSFGMAWSGCGLGIVVLIAAIAITAARLHQPAILAASGLVAFAFYGTAWMVSGAMTRQGWMFASAAAAFVITLLLAFLSGSAAQLLAFGVGLLLTLSIPGMLLMRRVSL